MTSGEIRTKLYQYVGGILGREVTTEEHDAIKALVVEYGSVTRVVSPTQPLEHHYVCTKCGGVVKKVGHNQRKKFEKGKHIVTAVESNTLAK